MVGLTGLEKFSHLEDKIYRTIELTKTLRQEKEGLERELASVRRELGALLDEKDRLETQVERLLSRHVFGDAPRAAAAKHNYGTTKLRHARERAAEIAP